MVCGRAGMVGYATMKVAEFLLSLRDEPPWEQVAEINVASSDISGDTPLHWALWRKDEEAAVGLIQAGAEIEARGEEGYRPLHVAIANECVASIGLLNERGVDWNATTEIGLSALEDAASSENALVRAFAGRVQ